MKKYNVIEIDEDFIGKVSELKGYFIDSLAKMLTDDSIDEENKISNVGITYDILQQLQDEKFDNAVVRVAYNPMGTYYIADSLDR